MTPLPKGCLGWKAVVLLLCLAFVGCGNPKVTKANFDQIKPGMTMEQVKAILGPGDSENPLDLSEGSGAAGGIGLTTMSPMSSSKPSTQWYRWGDDNKHIRIGFKGDKVVETKQQGL
jgi:hypothetical protein